MRQFSKEQIAHVMNGDVLTAALEALETKHTKRSIHGETVEERESHRDVVKALGSIKTELKAMHQKESR